MLDKNFDPAGFEARLYDHWEAAGVFGPSGEGAPYTVVIPPPNVTGSLHIGHALNNTLQDVLVRFRRMQGRDALWMPGTDHAGIATQMVVERQLAQAKQPGRRELGREAFLERVWAWKEESGGTISRQLRRLGSSLDWPRERFTMDAGLSQAVVEVFVRLHKAGLIYQDKRLVNWDPVFQTAISDLEVESREVKGSLWHIRYPVEGGGEIVVATTRPETMLGDTAVAVHPEDGRFAGLVGRHVVLPLTGRRIPIIADEYSDPEKGTGAVKITPAHDFNDFEVGRRHGLAMPSVLDAEARVTLAEIEAEGFVATLAGLDRFAARKLIVAELERLEMLVLVEAHTHQVPHGDRSGVPIEPRMTVQWYCNAAELAKKPIESVESGRVKFEPDNWKNLFFSWMRDIQPWCISRQLWWGHQIPAWHAADGRVFVERSEAEAQAAAGEGVVLTRDADVLDTWFSSALWPFSTLGWPEQTPLLEKHYPTDVLVTGFDIIFFWVARMMMMGEFCMGREPFSTVVIHGLVRDEKGAKMSKSKGNVMDPLELIDAYGADAVRFTLCALASPGRDIKLSKQRMEGYRAFVTKLWNAARFLETNGIAPNPAWKREEASGVLARWLLEKTDAVVREATTALEGFRFDDYANAVHGFTWGVFCDWFIELAKPVLNGEDGAEKAEIQGVAQHVLGVVLRLLHPVMPFVTAELHSQLGYGDAVEIVTCDFPTAPGFAAEDVRLADIDTLIAAVTAIRSVRAAMNVPPSSVVPLRVALAGQGALSAFLPQLLRLARVEAPVFVENAAADAGPGAMAVAQGIEMFMPLAGVIDLAAEAVRLKKERQKAEEQARQAEVKLANPDFVARAKEEVIQEMSSRLSDARALIDKLDRALGNISA
ncbi:valine--tRNA ligase [Rhodovarius sp.]|uniref:valine--tRNA ligase n=1 Tax=Rhodovarius sp. TaxID=2972673 RepID=UPI0033409F0E